MHEQTKASSRRKNDRSFREQYFVGRGIDVGCGNDSMRRTMNNYHNIESIMEFDKQHGDAQLMSGITDGKFDFLHSSHSLEHMSDPYVTIINWIRIVRSGGYLVITVPDWEMYERCRWPSQFSPEHLWAFTCNTAIVEAGPICLIDVWGFFLSIESGITIEKIQVIRDYFQHDVMTDQTLGPAECAIEIILRKS